MNVITSYWPFLLIALAVVLVVVLERKKIGALFGGAKAKTSSIGSALHGDFGTVKSDAEKVISELKPHLESIASSLNALHAKTAPAAAAASASGDGTTPPTSGAPVNAASGGTAPAPGADVVAAHAALDATIAKHTAIVTQAQDAKATLTAQTAQASKDALAAATEPEAATAKA